MVLNEQRRDDDRSQRFKKFGDQKYTLTYVFYIYMNVNQEHSQKFSKEMPDIAKIMFLLHQTNFTCTPFQVVFFLIGLPSPQSASL